MRNSNSVLVDKYIKGLNVAEYENDSTWEYNLFDFSESNITSFKLTKNILVLMPITLNTILHNIEMSFDKEIGKDASGMLGVFKSVDNKNFSEIGNGVLMSSYKSNNTNPESGEVTSTILGNNKNIPLFPGRHRCMIYDKGTTKEEHEIFLTVRGKTIKEFLLDLNLDLTIEIQPNDEKLFLGFKVGEPISNDVTGGSFYASFREK